jgi:multiple antibiotic resistance protein
VDLKLFGEVFVTLLVILDPPGAVPIFLALTGQMERRHRHRAALQAVALACGVVVAFAVVGRQILSYLHIDQVTTNVALVPLGTPLLAGPGAIVATMLFVRRADHFSGYLAVAVGILAVMIIVYLVLRFSGVLVRILRPSGIEVVTRIAGLLVAAIAVQLLADAIGAFVTTYLHSPH